MTSERVAFRSVFAVGDFRSMWAAEAVSEAGDQLARVALAVLVFDRTSSAVLTGLTYALSFVPTIVGGVFLSGIADRYPRKTVMVTSDVIRAVLLAGMAVPDVPLPVLWTLLVAMTLLGPPYKAAQLALLPSVLPRAGYLTVGMAIRNVTMYSAQLVGFAGGGELITLLNPSTGLMVDGATFLVSAGLVGWGVHSRPAPAPAEHRATTGVFGPAMAGLRLVWQDRGLRALLVICCLAGFYIVPEGLAAPYAATVSTSSLAVGLIMASDPTGGVIGAVLFARFVPARLRPRLVGILGVAAGVPLLVCAVRPNLVVSIALFVVTGAITVAYTMQASTSYLHGLPDEHRGQGSGLLSMSVSVVQGVGVLAGGVLSDLVHPAHAIALAGAAGMAVAAFTAVAWGRVFARSGGALRWG